MNSSIPVSLNNITTPAPKPQKEILILHWLILGIALVGLPGNGTVLWFLGFRMHKNAFYTYILHLALADFLFLCCQVIDSLLILTRFRHPFSFNNPYHNFLIIAKVFLYIVSLSILSTISAERCISVLWPIWYRCHRHKRLLALLLRVRSSQRLPMTRLYVTILLTVLVFVLCGLPCGITWIYVLGNEFLANNYIPHYHVITIFLSCVNSSANPIIYFFVGSFRQQLRGQSFKQVLQRALQDTPEAGNSESSLPQATQVMPGRSLL
ncbi:mas-related G-protein coupled receptor member X2-like [Ochotona curzoniae]|uniref:mas-related G-protein coupled receptor member X2-like n=1 Tax=Ochotona curzoniae TaxID=130825 RepID=UPI001B34C93F|nr:mas-related G-protein coupled receptor member X2-like [Ochotona curzoniae]